MNILGVIGSPRVGGNTDRVVDKILEGATCGNATTSKIHLSKLRITPCRGCERCKQEGRCVVNDDMAGVLEQLERSSVWVLGTPVYFLGPTAWFKAFVDRFYGARLHIDFTSKKAIIVVPLEDSKVATARHTVGMIRDTLVYLGVEVLADLVIPGVMKKGEVDDHPDILDRACRLGLEAASGEVA
jgi:multimeric flavodoxin WrbA